MRSRLRKVFLADRDHCITAHDLSDRHAAVFVLCAEERKATESARHGRIHVIVQSQSLLAHLPRDVRAPGRFVPVLVSHRTAGCRHLLLSFLVDRTTDEARS